MNILKIDSSISGEHSVSRRLTSEIARQFGGADVTRDLVADPLPHLTARGQDPEILEEFLAADMIIIGAPMYNFTIPTQLKAWLDRLAVAGRTFEYTAEGPRGLAGDKRVVIALASGGVYEDDSPFEHSKSYLTAFFNFIGIQPEFVSASGVAVSPEAAADAIDSANETIERLAA